MPPLRARIVCTLSIAFCLVALSACASGGALEGKTAAPDASEERAGEGRTGGAERPNIVLIMADDLGYGNIEPYGQRHIQTPHLERMARQGTRFAEFYAGSTVCAPSRSVLMTGLHTGHTPIRGNRPVYPIGQEPLPPKTVTMAEMLSGAGTGRASSASGGWAGPSPRARPAGRDSTSSLATSTSGARTSTGRSFCLPPQRARRCGASRCQATK
jgi:hypothetical protein